MRHRLRRVIWTLIHHVRRPFRLQVCVGTESDLADWPVFPEEVVEVGAGDVEVPGEYQDGVGGCQM